MVKSCPKWHKRLSSSNEWGAQDVSRHQTTIKRKKTTPGSVCLPDRCVMLLCTWYVKQNLKLQRKNRFLAVWHGCTVEELLSTEVHKGPQEQRDSRKGWKNARLTVALYLDELLIQKCEFGSQVSRHSPQIGLPHLALWHHVGVTIGITLDKNGSL